MQPLAGDHTEGAEPRPNLPTMLLAHFSLRYTGFEERVAAAAAAGFDGIGCFVDDYSASRRDGWTDDALTATLARHGLRAPELEALTGWATTGERGPQSLEREETLWHMADVFRATHVQAIGPYEGSFDDCVTAYRRVCDRAAERHLRVGLEFLPFTNITNAGIACAIVEAADRPNGGLCVDSWHHFRGADDWALIEAIPPERVVNIQLDDGPIVPVVPDYLTDTISYRDVPGEGEFDLVRFLGTLREMGVEAPISVEVISLDLQQLPAAEVAQRLADATRTVLRAAGW